MNPHAIEERKMLWLMLLAVWGAAAIVVVIIWGKLVHLAVWGAAAIVVAFLWGRLVHRGQGSDDESLADPPTADSDARPAVPSADSDHIKRAGRHMRVVTEP
jgi:hypothetical protein